ncbi:DUF2520 domain-containing protein [Flavobacteriales bacterium]|nr:DUF2520 domain-containing protein [Flavobacteriales bacterium]
MIQSAHVIGQGRLGHHWADRLEELGIRTHRWSRTPSDNVRDLHHWDASLQTDAVFIAVPDGAISEVAARIAPGLQPGTLLAHHAGAVPLNALPVPPSDRAVMWPPMTFISGQAPDWSTMPIAVETVNPHWINWAQRISPKAFSLTSDSRRALHVGAVLAGNLTAAWLGTVEGYLETHQLSLDVLAPLVEESVSNALKGKALTTVSGPASRNDRTTLEHQTAVLSDPSHGPSELATLHRILTNRILHQHGHDPLPPFQATAPTH